jgi:hypothetical protein
VIFRLHVSMPCHASLAVVIRDLAAQAVRYTKLNAAVGRTFIARAERAGANAMAGAGSCAVDIQCDGTELKATIGGATIRQPLTA